MLGRNNLVDYLVNVTRNEYINLNSANSDETISSIVRYLHYNGIWDISDNVKHVMKHVKYVPDTTSKNISYILDEYNKQPTTTKEFSYYIPQCIII